MRNTILAILATALVYGNSFCFAQLKFGEEVGNVEVQTLVISAGDLLDDRQFQNTVAAYRTATEVPENAKLQLAIVPWFDPSKGIRRMIQTITPLDANGKPHGEVHAFRPLIREVVHIVTYRHGVLHGVEKKWDGTHERKRYLRLEIPWQNGKVHGERKIYHANGKVMTSTKYNNGKEEGESRSFDAEGRVERTVTFRGGKKNGELKDFWPETKKLRRVIPYRNGTVEGTVREYYSDGKRKREVPLKNNAMHGIEKVFDANGKQVEARYWIDGAMVPENEFRKQFTP